MRKMYSENQLDEIVKNYIHEHEDVKANVQVVGTEDYLLTIEIDGDKYIIPQGTEVEANPTLAGTEAELTGLQVGDVKYKIPNELPTITGNANKVLKVNNDASAVEWGDVANELPSVTGNADKILKVNSGGTGVEWGYTSQLGYLTTAPSQDNTSGLLQIVVLSSEPATYYDGYYYIITGA